MGTATKPTVIRIRRLYKFKKKRMVKKANRVVALMNLVINSDEFEDAIINHKYTDTRFRLDPDAEFRTIDSGEEILEILRKGREQGSDQGDDYTWNLEIKLGRFSGVVGTRLGNLITTQNWLLKEDNNDPKVASHWFHEYAHMLGFHHDRGDSNIRPNSVPYALNTIVEDVIKKLKKD